MFRKPYRLELIRQFRAPETKGRAARQPAAQLDKLRHVARRARAAALRPEHVDKVMRRKLQQVQ